VFRVPRSGSVELVATGFSGAVDIAVTDDGTIYVAEPFGGQISQIVDSDVSVLVEVTEPAAVEVAPAVPDARTVLMDAAGESEDSGSDTAGRVIGLADHQGDGEPRVSREVVGRLWAIAGRLAAAAGLVVLSVTGCGGGGETETNGLEKKSPAEVLQAATAAFRASHGVHVVGTGTSEGSPLRIDLRIQDGSSSGTITIDDAGLEVTTLGDDAYIRGDQQVLQGIGVSAETARLGANRWLKSSPQQLGLEGFTLDAFAADMARPDTPLNPTVEQTELNGKKVVVVSTQAGSNSSSPTPASPTHCVSRTRDNRPPGRWTSPNTAPTSISPHPRAPSNSESSPGSRRSRS
jgi:hypothetical protein